MSVVSPTYCTREDIKSALDVAETARSNERVDRAAMSATVSVDGLVNRTFIPWIGTRFFDFPTVASPTPWQLWLDDQELISATSVASGGVTIGPSSYFLSPANYGPPYNAVEINLASSSAFSSGSTWQRTISIAGTWGYRQDEVQVAVLAGTLAADPTATANVTWLTSAFGVGSLLRIDAEWMLVADRTMTSSGQTLQTPMTATMSNVTVAVTDGTSFAVDETILLDGERMRVVDIAGNTLVVRRAQDGSVLTAHTGSTIWTLTGVKLVRAQQGSTLAAHSNAAPIYRQTYPAPVRDLAIAYGLTQMLQEAAGYSGSKVQGADRSTGTAAGSSLSTLEEMVSAQYGRQLRMRAV